MGGWFRRRGEPRTARTTITDSVHWHVSTDLYSFIRALPDLLPAGSILGLAEGVWDSEMEEFLAKQAATPDGGLLGTKPRVFEKARFISADRATLQALSELADGYAQPEIAIHLIVLQGDRTLLEWYDVDDDPIALHASFDEEQVARHELSKPRR